MGSKRITHLVFAVVLIGWGILGLVNGDFAPGWEPVPESMPARHALAYLCSIVCIAAGVGLFWRRTAVFAARVLFFYLLLWLLLLRLPMMAVSFGVGTWWSSSSAAILAASAWILYSSLANNAAERGSGLLTGATSVRIARILFGLGLIPIGLAHFIYLQATAPLVPGWMLWPVFWAYFTGGAFIAAGLAMITGVFARLAVALVTLQIGLLTLLIWVPKVIVGHLNAFQWGEFVVSIVLTTCAWVVADSYRGSTWLAWGRRDSRGTL
ncbi:MAG: DoxX family protein [Pyrinomonadaceae bacterium]